MSNAKRGERVKGKSRHGKGGRAIRHGARAKPGLSDLWKKLDGRRKRRGAAPAPQSNGGPEAQEELDEAGPSSLGRLYEDFAEHGRLSEPPQSPTRLLELDPSGEEAFELSPPQESVFSNPSVEESVESLVQTLVDEVYDELDEGSVRMPGADHQQTGPTERDDEWLSVEGLMPS